MFLSAMGWLKSHGASDIQTLLMRINLRIETNKAFGEGSKRCFSHRADPRYKSINLNGHPKSIFGCPFKLVVDLLRGVSEEGKKSHFLSIRRLFEGV